MHLFSISKQIGRKKNIFIKINLDAFENVANSVIQQTIRTRLPGAVPQPLFLLLIVFGCIIFFKSSLIFKKIRTSSFFK